MSVRENPITITYVPVAELQPYPRNSRTHSPKQVDQIAASMGEFGFTSPLLIDENRGIIAGHGRLMAAKQRRMQEVPCIVLPGLSETQKRALVIADNKLALNAGWDQDMLCMELGDILEDVGGEDLIRLTGFDQKDLERLLGEIEIPSLPDPPSAGESTAHTCPACGHQWVPGGE